MIKSKTYQREVAEVALKGQPGFNPEDFERMYNGGANEGLLGPGIIMPASEVDEYIASVSVIQPIRTFLRQVRTSLPDADSYVFVEELK